MKLTNNKLEQLIMEVLSEATVKPENINNITMYKKSNGEPIFFEKNSKGQWEDDGDPPKVVDMAKEFNSGKYDTDPGNISFTESSNSEELNGDSNPNLMSIFQSGPPPVNNPPPANNPPPVNNPPPANKPPGSVPNWSTYKKYDNYTDGGNKGIKYSVIDWLNALKDNNQLNLHWIVYQSMLDTANVDKRTIDWLYGTLKINNIKDQWKQVLLDAGVTNYPSDQAARKQTATQILDYLKTNKGTNLEAGEFATKQGIDPYEDLLKIVKGIDSSLEKELITLLGNNLNSLKKMSESVLKENQNILEPEDFRVYYKKAVDTNDNTVTKADSDKVDSALKTFYMNVKNSTTLDSTKKSQILNKISKVIEYEKTASGKVRATKGVTSGYQLGSRAATETGKTDFQILKAFEKAFPGPEFRDRLSQFTTYTTEISNFLQDPTSGISGDARQKFSKFITLDLMQQILYDFEASSAGWVFESFLAFMAFGNAIGASYGAGDFTIGNDVQGSAKLLQGKTSSQSVADWPKASDINSIGSDNIIRYVFGVKTSFKDGEMAPTTQKDRAGRVDVYIFDLAHVEVNGKAKVLHRAPESGTWDENDFFKVKTDGNTTRVSFSVSGYKPIGSMNLLFLQEREFEDYSALIVNNISEDLEKAMQQISNIKANLDDYLQTDNADDRTYASSEAMRNYALLGTSLEGDGTKTGVFNALEESKLQTLDQLIAETMREIKRKRKK
tara:strand:+ start:747 stop:2927 length:2181 start_codon:yes stop_codon:yes gene_type:complete